MYLLWKNLQASFVRHTPFQSSEGSKGFFSNTPSSDLCRILASIFPIPQQAFQHLEEQEGLLLWWTWLLCGLVPTELVCNPPNTKTAASAVELQKIISSD